MQETLDLKDKSITYPEINTSALNSSSEFLQKLQAFNVRWNTDINVQNSARWEAGSYKKFKELAVRLFNPEMEKLKSINRIFSHHTWNINNARDSLNNLNHELKTYRDQGIKFNDSSDKEGEKMFALLIANINESLSNNPEITVDISKVPWFRRNGYARRYKAKPIFTHQGHLEGYHNDYVKLAVEDVPETTDPRDIYLNIAIPLIDVNVKVTNNYSDDKLLYEYEYGNLVVCQTVSIFDAIVANRLVASGKGRLQIEGKFSGLTYKYPLYSALEHPFVSRGRERTHQYGTGNTCFGDLTEHILSSICRGELSHTKLLLQQWSSIYPKNNVSPLNRHYVSVFGKPLQIKKGHEDDVWSAETSLCKRQITDYPEEISKQDFIETFCSNCAILKNCSTYTEFTYVPRELSESEIELLDNFSKHQYDTNIMLNNEWASLKNYQDFIKAVYLTIDKGYKQRVSGGRSTVVFLLNKFRVSGRNTGLFHTQESWNALIEKQEKATEFTIEDFIFWYNTAERIYYSDKAKDVGFEINIHPNMTEKEMDEAISEAQSIYVAIQRKAGVSQEGIFTYFRKFMK